MDYVIFDIDGTLANCEHRRHHVANRDWKSFFEAMDKDAPIEPVIELLCMAAESKSGWGLHNRKIVLCTGRPEDYFSNTTDWLKRHKISYDHLMMRPAGDHRPDVIVKREMLSQLRNEFGCNPLFVVDDRQSVVDMWRSEGLTCLQAAPGDWEKPKLRGSLGRLNIMVGPSHAGKSSFLEVEANPANVVSSDSIRFQLTGDYRDQSENARVFAVLHELVRTRILCGLNTWVDATNIKNKNRLAVVDAVPAETEIFYYVLDRPLAEKRADIRPGFPAHVIDKHHNTFRSNSKAILNGDGRKNVTVRDLREAA